MLQGGRTVLSNMTRGMSSIRDQLPHCRFQSAREIFMGDPGEAFSASFVALSTHPNTLPDLMHASCSVAF
jgi:hypothetical protein